MRSVGYLEDVSVVVLVESHGKRNLQVLAMVIAFGVGVGIEDNECALNQFRAAWPVGIADVIDEVKSYADVDLSFP